jgi:chemotaxis protein MotA
MFVVIGIVVVFGAVIGGYLMEHGNLKVLVQPAELVVLGGAALGTLLIANPLHVLKAVFGGIMGTLSGSKYDKTKYLETLKMMFELLSRARKEGLMALESDSDAPDKSPVFSKYPKFLKDHHALHFVCDTIRMASGGGVEAFDVDQMMEMDMDTHHHESGIVVAALSTVADALPGLGIVAAVLGVIITMGALGGPPEEIGHKVAAALVGTFLGILLCYGVIGEAYPEMCVLVFKRRKNISKAAERLPRRQHNSFHSWPIRIYLRSSSRKKSVMAVIMAAHGKWPMRTL